MEVPDPHRAQPDWQALVLERIAAHGPLMETLDLLVLLVEAELPDALGSLLLLDADAGTLHAGSVRSLPAAYNAAIEGASIGPMAGSCGTAAFLGEPVYVGDIDTDPRWVAYLGLARAHDLRACWSTPILSTRATGARQVLGTFALYYRAPRLPDAYAEAVLARAGSLACIAIEAYRATDALHASEQRFRMLVDHATDAFTVQDADDGTILDVNAQACASLGYTRAELIGARPTLFDPSMTPAVLAELLGRLRAGETVTMSSRHRRKDGSEFPVEVRLRTFSIDGRSYDLALARDISARIERDERLRRDQKMEAVARLAGGVAHDFNNLLTVIIGHAELALQTLPDHDPLRDDLAEIAAASERGAGLAAQLLAFSRRSIVAPVVVELGALVTRMTRIFDGLLGAQIALATRIAPDAAIVADPNLVEKVLVNLVTNARDAMPRGGTVTIAARRRTDGVLVALSITDTGDGMPPEVLARVCEPFFTTKPVGHRAGLGLATVHGIVTQAGGTIRIDSEVGRGTTVELLLPAAPSVLRPLGPPAAPTAHAPATILYVEDEPAVRRVTTRSLERWGYVVLAAEHAAAALAVEQAHAGAIDLLLTDVVMPGLGGRALASQIKARRPAIAVIYMSGYTDDEVVREGITAGVDAFVQKPFALATLDAAIRAALDAR
jgi:PAS domain S-box-containing protein